MTSIDDPKMVGRHARARTHAARAQSLRARGDGSTGRSLQVARRPGGGGALTRRRVGGRPNAQVVRRGALVGTGNRMGEPIPLSQAEDHLFGVCILNDWSARDIQAWEYQPLGPFLAKNFASSISPWVVTVEALAPFRAPLAPRAVEDPAPLPYLDDAGDRAHGGFAITMEVALQTARMRAAGLAPERITRGSTLDLYWSMGQMLAHHASNGCAMRPGDLLGSGTVSGRARDTRGCLLELTWRGAEPLALSNGETRAFLEDGDEVVMTAYAERDGVVRIGLGCCRGRIEPTRG